METIHIAAYALCSRRSACRTVSSRLPRLPGHARQARLHAAVRGRDRYRHRRTLAMFGGFTEGLQLFASFAMLMNFPRHNKMKGMGQIVSWRCAESLHCEGMIKVSTPSRPRPAASPSPSRRHRRLLQDRRRSGGQVHRSGVRSRRNPGHDPRRHQEVHPLHRRLAPAAAAAAGGVRGEGEPAAVAAEHAVGRGARQLLRGEIDGIFQGGHAGTVARRRGRVGELRRYR